MPNPIQITNTIIIKATPTQVWDMLTNPEKTKQYMFGCETVSDWEIGSSLLWNAIYEGKEMTFVKGVIHNIIPNQLLSYTVFDPNSTMPDIPENYLTVQYALTALDGSTQLVVTQGDYSTVAEWERRYQESYNGGEGWNPILIAIKQILEA